MAIIEEHLENLPTRDVAGVAWWNNGEVILVDSPEEPLKSATVDPRRAQNYLAA
jgi:hypothetical protein